MLAASVAAGIGANLGAPIGAVLFSIEVTSTYYPLRNYWHAYLSSIIGAITMRFFWNKRWGLPYVNLYKFTIRFTKLIFSWLTAILPTSFEHLEFSWLELIIFIVLGIVNALLGVLFIKLSFTSKKFWNKFTKNKWLESPYVYALLIAITTSTLSFPHLLGESIGVCLNY